MPNYNEPVNAKADGTAVFGASNRWVGVLGVTENGTTNGQPAGVYGLAANAHGVIGETKNGNGVLGITGNGVSTGGQAGVFGLAGQGAGVIGVSNTWIGVYGESQGTVSGSAGVHGVGKTNNIGVRGECPGGIGILGTGKIAAAFEGLVQAKNDMEVWGTLNVTVDIKLAGADCAEEFEIAPAESVDPGTVMVLGDEGALQASREAYDKRVAGIVSGAGDYQPGLVLDRQAGRENRQPIALMGKVFCKVDAGYGAIRIGDLLTTSPTPGHAMKAADPMQAFGAVIGKALRPLSEGQGLIPVLVTLQ